MMCVQLETFQFKKKKKKQMQHKNHEISDTI